MQSGDPAGSVADRDERGCFSIDLHLANGADQVRVREVGRRERVRLIRQWTWPADPASTG